MTVIDKAKFRQTVFELIENDDTMFDFPDGNIKVFDALAEGFLEGLIATFFDPKDSSLGWVSVDVMREALHARRELEKFSSADRMFGLIRDFEKDMRGFIMSRMCEHFSEQWIKMGVPKEIRKKWRTRESTAIQQGKQREANLLTYADLSDYKEIILHNW